MVLDSSIHEAVASQLARNDQRYTTQRRRLVDVLLAAGRPVTIPEVLASAPELTQSGAYRNMMVLRESGVVERVAGGESHGCYELAEAFSGHHHHLVCEECGTVADLSASPKLEHEVGEAIRTAEEQGYQVTAHRLELYGRCGECLAS
jgi:Fe2+ or Zn2+ uptake regulation protein